LEDSGFQSAQIAPEFRCHQVDSSSSGCQPRVCCCASLVLKFVLLDSCSIFIPCLVSTLYHYYPVPQIQYLVTISQWWENWLSTENVPLLYPWGSRKISLSVSKLVHRTFMTSFYKMLATMQQKFVHSSHRQQFFPFTWRYKITSLTSPWPKWQVNLCRTFLTPNHCVSFPHPPTPSPYCIPPQQPTHPNRSSTRVVEEDFGEGSSALSIGLFPGKQGLPVTCLLHPVDYESCY